MKKKTRGASKPSAWSPYAAADMAKLFDWQHERYQHFPLFGFSEHVEWLETEGVAEALASSEHVLVTGATGVGKELVVREIARRAGYIEEKDTLLVVNCAELAPAVVESELFGHVKGAFTGAASGREGLIRAADGNAVFLDEVGALRQHVQAKLLRVMESKALRKLGSDKIEYLTKGVRLFAASDRPDRLRQDFRWRFGHEIHVPPLCERPSDLFAILRGFLELEQRRHAIPMDAQWWISPDTLVRMLYSKWPGNVRELKNATSRSLARWRARRAEGYPTTSAVPFRYRPAGPELLRCPIALSSLWHDLCASVQALPEGREAFSEDRLLHGHALIHLMERFVPVFAPRTGESFDTYDAACDGVTGLQHGFSCVEAARFVSLVVARRQRAYDWAPAPESEVEATGKRLEVGATGNRLEGARLRLWQAAKELQDMSGVRTDGPLARLHRLDRYGDRLLALPDDLRSIYHEDGSRKPLDEPPPNLTGLTEEALLGLYYRQQWDRHGQKKAVAEAAGVSPNRAARMLAKYHLASMRSRTESP